MEKYAVTLALMREDEVFFVRRPSTAAEFAGFLSLPTRSITKAEYELVQVGDEILSPYFGVEGVAVAKATRQRDAYTLHMVLVISQINPSEIEEKIHIYLDKGFYDATQAIHGVANVCGLCVSMLFQHLMRTGKLKSPANYLEVSPTLAGVDLALVSDADLWRNARYWVNIENGENTERYGKYVKSHTVDKFIKAILFEDRKEFVELGSGDGALVRELALCGIKGKGYDLEGPKLVEDGCELACHDVLDSKLLRSLDCETVVMNLLIQWVADLDFLVESISCAPAVNKLIVSWVPAEFSKDGFWVENLPGKWVWCVENALREGPQLTMIDSRVGPVRLYKRLIPTVVNIFRRHGFAIHSLEYLNFDRCASKQEQLALYENFPAAKRNSGIPQFVVMVLERLE